MKRSAWYTQKTKNDSVDICDCIGRELYVRRGCVGRPPWPNGMYDSDGYLLCGFCGLIENKALGIMCHPLAQCDTCFGFFKGYKRYPTINYTCPKCEAKL
jgi:hypothetical protein